MKKIVKYLIVLAFVMLLMPLFFVDSSAKELFDDEFFNSANTYNLSVERDSKYYKFSFDKNNKNDNLVDDKPTITILTHGLSGTAADYSKDRKGFAYNEHSLITALDRKEDSNIYHVVFSSEFNFKILKIVDKLTYETQEISHITDISKHSIILFSGYGTTGSNDYVYSQFNIMTSYILNDFKALKNNVLPMINLIGFSRGGLTNMQYALDHPDVVYSIFSFDSPYFSTSIADMDYAFKDIEPIEDNGGIYAIQDEKQYLSYYNRWNDNYELYEHIDANAIGMYQPLALMFYQLIYSFLTPLIVNNYSFYITMIYTMLQFGSRLFYECFQFAEVFKLLSRNFTEKGVLGLQKFMDEMKIENGEVYLYFDGLVDFDSQLARSDKYNYSYNGFKRFICKLSYANNNRYFTSARLDIYATHAIATYIEEAQEYVLNNIRMA